MSGSGGRNENGESTETHRRAQNVAEERGRQLGEHEAAGGADVRQGFERAKCLLPICRPWLLAKRIVCMKWLKRDWPAER